MSAHYTTMNTRKSEMPKNNLTPALSDGVIQRCGFSGEG